MAGSQKNFRVHTPFKCGVQGAQGVKSAPWVHWGFVLGCIIFIYGIMGCMDFQVEPFLRRTCISLLIENVIFQYNQGLKQQGVKSQWHPKDHCDPLNQTLGVMMTPLPFFSYHLCILYFDFLTGLRGPRGTRPHPVKWIFKAVKCSMYYDILY